MGKRSILIVIILFFIAGQLVTQEDQFSWKLVRSNDGIKSYVRKNPDSKIRSVKVETIIEVSLSELVYVITNVDNHSEWVFFNSYSEILDSIDQFNWIYYGINDLPWPITDRDIVARTRMRQDTVDCSITMISEGLPEYIPEKEGCIRILDTYSRWDLNPLGNGTVHIQYELTTDVGGSIPVWFINLAVTRGPTESIVKLIKLIKSGKHSGVDLDYIREF